jgi:hypothetical protein
MEGKQLDELIKNIQADPRRMQLLGILGTQLERLVGEGQPDLHALYDGLRQQKLVSQKELEHLRLTFALDSVSDRNPPKTPSTKTSLSRAGSDAERYLR